MQPWEPIAIVELEGTPVQHNSSMNILCQIMELYKSKSVLFEDLLYTDSDGKKLLPLDDRAEIEYNTGGWWTHPRYFSYYIILYKFVYYEK